MTTAQSRAGHIGVLLGLVAIALATTLQAVVAILSFADYNGQQRLAYCVLPFILAGLLVVPVRPSRWPVSGRRARNVGAVWLALGLAWPFWLYVGQFPVAAGIVAGPAALIGALVAARRRP